MDLASRDSYIQKLASKVLNQQDEEKKKKKRPFGEIIYTLDTQPCMCWNCWY